MRDPSHPSLFYHLFLPDGSNSSSPVFALSLCEERPSHARSRAVLGFLPAAADSTSKPEDADEGSGLNDFVANST